jgi:hypothetical protein
MSWSCAPKSTKGVSVEEFIVAYAKSGNKTPRQVLRGRVPLPCDCDDSACTGWQMRPMEVLLDDVETI